jgi:hypothetical protein
MQKLEHTIKRGTFAWVDKNHEALVTHVFANGLLLVNYRYDRHTYEVLRPEEIVPSRDACWLEVGHSDFQPQWDGACCTNCLDDGDLTDDDAIRLAGFASMSQYETAMKLQGLFKCVAEVTLSGESYNKGIHHVPDDEPLFDVRLRGLSEEEVRGLARPTSL